MSRLRLLAGGTMLAASNVYAAISIFVTLTVLFNNFDLKSFASISLMFTLVSIFQVAFNTQSWQGLLNSGIKEESGLLRRCLAIDFAVAVTGSTFLLLGFVLLLPSQIPNDVGLTPLYWLALNVALTPSGTLVGVIRQEGRFAQQALVDILVSTLRIVLVLTFVRSATGLLAVALVLPEFLRWCGYLILSAPRLVRKGKFSNDHSEISPSKIRPTLRTIYGFSVWGMLNEIIHLPTTHIDKLLVSALLGLEYMAIWDIIKRCGAAVVQITSVVNQMLFPHYVRVRDNLSVENLFKQCLMHCTVLSLLLLLLYSLATVTLPLWLTLAFHIDTVQWPLAYLQKVFALFAIVMCFILGATPVHSLFLSLRHSSESFRISLVGNFIFFGLSVLLIPWWGLFGTSLSILGSDAFIILTKFRLISAVENRTI